MAAIKGKNTKPEMVVRRYLWAHGFRYRLNDARLPGKPDIVLRRYRTCIFVNGCFWHGHEGCKYYTVPKSNTEFWVKKIGRNRERELRKADNIYLVFSLYQNSNGDNYVEKELRDYTWNVNSLAFKGSVTLPYTKNLVWLLNRRKE
jgi:DNA mismatch endonuclease Vsr